jgi:asparagine synthase (glutamine-hydrolysing)
VCGIAGAVGLSSRSAGEEMVRRMLPQLVHRGPDDEGTWAEERVALGMRRLSIIDLPGGHQPMRSEDGVTIVYNGEAYNYRRLRSELQATGSRFRTESDTEVVLELYRARGIEAVDALEGMFAFSIYDPRDRTLHLVRDRLGKKPLYYGRVGEGLAFASEIKGLLAGFETRPELNRQALYDYLTLRYVPSPETAWKGITKLEPGERLSFELDTGALRLTRWWEPIFNSEPRDPDRDYEGEFERLLLDAVEKRLLAADVPVGVLLSGGIDSSAVSAAAVELGHRDFHTFSVGFAGDRETSELEYARALSRHIGSRHHEVEVDREAFIGFLPQLTWATDEPLADLAAIPLHFVSRLAREQVKVVLSGEGADEVLAGYNLERTAAALERWRRIDRMLPTPVARAGARLAPSGRATWLSVLAQHGWSGLLSGSRTHMTFVFTDAEKRRVWPDSNGLRPTEELLDEWYGNAASSQPLDQLQEVYCRSWLVEDLLMKADKMSMLASLELRTPFLDHDLVEWAASAPLDLKVGDSESGWESKRVLRRFAARRVPPEIVQRPKRGFPVPAYGWLAGPVGEWAEERLLAPADNPLSKLFELDELRPAIDAARGGDLPAAHKVWSMLVLEQWLETWS